MSTALTVMDERSLTAIEDITKQCSMDALAEVSGLRKTALLAAGINALRKAVSQDMVRELMALQGSSLGFRTDRDDKQGYDPETVKECAIEVLLRGGNWVGNEFNIIAGRAYLTKEYFTRKVREFPGLTDLKLFPGVPQHFGDKGALVPYSATWKLNGVADRIDRKLNGDVDERIPVKVNSGMGSDAILGKADRKILAAIYKRLTGSDVADGEADDVPLVQQSRTPVKSIDALTETITKPSAPAPFELAAVEARFEACATFADCGKLMAELRPTIPADQKDAVGGFDEKARNRIREATAAAKKGTT